MPKIVALWCHPRSMSTALERVMRERGDMTVLHEPFMYDYYLARGVRRFPHWEPDPDAPRSYGEIRDHILAEAEKGPVFFKDMAFYVADRLPQDPDFARAIAHAFLVRDPGRAIASYHRLDPDLTGEEIGIEAQERLRRALTGILGEAPPVVRAEDVQRDPERVVGLLWQRLGLDPAPHAFNWDGEPPADWQGVGTWHGRASSTSGIEPPRGGGAEAWARAVAAAPHLEAMRARHQPAYERLAAEALN